MRTKSRLILVGLAVVFTSMSFMVADTAQAVIFNVSTPAEFQSALDAAGTNDLNDTIYVAAGTYNLSQPLTYLASGSTGYGRLTIEGDGAGTTILDGGNNVQILKLEAQKTTVTTPGYGFNTLVVRGLTFRNGLGTNGGSDTDAGGLHAVTTRSHITVENCAFEGNESTSYQGVPAGVYLRAGSAANRCMSVFFRNNTVYNNTGGIGGAHFFGCGVTLEGNVFEGNEGLNGQGGAWVQANSTSSVSTNSATVIDNQFNLNVGALEGGLGVISRNVSTVTGNSFVGNISGPGEGGGGLWMQTDGNINFDASMIADNIFQDNSSTGSNPGGAVFIRRLSGFGGAYYTLANNVFLNNSSATGEGSVLYFINYSPTYPARLNFLNNTATMNSGTAVNITIRTSQDQANVYNNIIWGNDADLEIVDSSASQDAMTRVFNNDLTTFTAPTGTKKTEGSNIDIDPLLEDTAGGDVHLQATSPVINQGYNNAPGLADVTTDFEGEARIQGGTVDIGADESDAVPVFPDINVTGSGSFGNVTLNTTVARTVTVDNTGEADLTVGTIALSGSPAFALSADNCSSMAITPTESPCTVRIEFTPDSVAAFAGTLTIPSDDPNENPVVVQLSGNGVAPQPEINVTDSVAPTGDLSIPYGDVQENTTKTETVTVENLGAGALSVGTLTLASGASFSITADNCSGTSVPVSGNCTLDVEFRPGAAGAFADTLAIPSDDSDENPVTVALSGTGTATPVPDITVTDTSGNGTDRIIAFPTLTAGAGSYHEAVTIVNNGTANLVVNSIALTQNATFTIHDTDCSPLPVSLSPSGSCFVDILFEPADSGAHADTLTITSNDTGDNPVEVELNGDALPPAVNNPPNAFNLIYPADGQEDVEVPTEFRWDPTTDPDGDFVTYNIYVCTQSDFTGCASPVNTEPIAAGFLIQGTMYAGTGLGLMAIGIVLTGDGRRKWLAAALLAIILLSGLVFTSCRFWDYYGSGTDGTDEVVFTVDSLNPGTQYYWKVVASDGSDDTESGVWSFTTAP